MKASKIISYFRVYTGTISKGRTKEQRLKDINKGIKVRKLSRTDIISITPTVIQKNHYYEVWYWADVPIKRRPRIVPKVAKK